MNAAEGFVTLLQLIKKWEGCKLSAYQCSAGIWTIGYGETLGVKQGDVWTQAQAEERLKIRAAQFLDAVILRCPPLAKEASTRWVACTSLAYNIGVGAFAASSVCRHTKSGDYDKAADSFLLWNKARGKIIKGLDRRRREERAIYLSKT